MRKAYRVTCKIGIAVLAIGCVGYAAFIEYERISFERAMVQIEQASINPEVETLLESPAVQPAEPVSAALEEKYPDAPAGANVLTVEVSPNVRLALDVRTFNIRAPLNAPLQNTLFETPVPKAPKGEPHAVRQATLPAVTVTAPPKQPVKKQSAQASPPVRKQWGDMNGHERWQFVASYVKSKKLVCKDSGNTRAQEEAQLEGVAWGLVQGGVNTFCSPAASPQTAQRQN